MSTHDDSRPVVLRMRFSFDLCLSDLRHKSGPDRQIVQKLLLLGWEPLRTPTQRQYV